MATSRLNINLSVVAENYRYLDKLSAQHVKTGAVVKADGYGLGMKQVAQKLYQTGCRLFYVAQLQEGAALRRAFDERGWRDAQIVIFEGVPEYGDCDECAHYRLTPVVNQRGDAEKIARFQQKKGTKLPSILHVDTGMHRLGFGEDIGEALSEITLCGVMSHLACAEQSGHPLNTQQLEKMRALATAFPNLPLSLANSGGVFLGPPYHFDQVRPGIALYGMMPDPMHYPAQHPGQHNDYLRPVVTWEADIVQMRAVRKGESVGYGADWVATKDGWLAVLAVGYADGYARTLYTHKQEGKQKHGGEKRNIVEIEGVGVPLAGRISMDLSVVDVSALPESMRAHARTAVLIGTHYSLADMARDRNTISYEVMTGLGKRIKRLYDGHE